MHTPQDSMEVATSHYEWHKRHHTSRKNLPGLQKTGAHHSHKCSRYTWKYGDVKAIKAIKKGYNLMARWRFPYKLITFYSYPHRCSPLIIKIQMPFMETQIQELPVIITIMLECSTWIDHSRVNSSRLRCKIQMVW